MTWHGIAWHGIGLNYTYKEILNALKTKGRCNGVPSTNGTDVVNAWTKALCDIMEVKLMTTSFFYHPECNSQCERYNRTIIGIFRFLKEN